MASFVLYPGGAAVAPAGGRVFKATTTTKNKGGSSGESKGLVDWILGGLQKDNQLLETDPILKKVEEKNGTGSKRSIPVPKKKNGGFGGLFVKKD